MRNTKKSLLTFLFIYIFLLSTFNPNFYASSINEQQNRTESNNLEMPVLSNGESLVNIIISFNKKSFNQTVLNKFYELGGILIDGPWNNTFSTISGFSGIFPSENLTYFEGHFSEASIESNELIEVQMNYVVAQSNAMNSTWSLNGYTGNSNCSTAVLDTGIDPNNPFFPAGNNPINLTGNIISWKDFIQELPNPYDDNGHGTFISSIIVGTGTEPYNSTNTINMTFSGNYSHIEMFDKFAFRDNFTFKLATFNVSKENSQLFINSSWKELVAGIDEFWIELYNETSLVNKSKNVKNETYYQIYHNNSLSGTGLYDLFVKYHKLDYVKPEFSLDLELSFFPEYYIVNKTHFTGIANSSKIVSYKIMNQNGFGNVSSLISAMENVFLNRPILHITAICLSVGTLGDDVSTINEVINNIIENGTLVVIAAGNNGLESNSLNKLAFNKKAIVVGAINDRDKITTYSSMGKIIDEDQPNEVIKPDLVAPGGSRLKGYRSVVGTNLENRTTAYFGTSIAAAVVSGAIQLLIEAKWKNWTSWDSLNTTILAKIVKATLLMTATETQLDREEDPETDEIESDYSPNTNYGGKDIHEGYGRLNVEAAIDALTKNISTGIIKSDFNLTSSEINPLGKHVYARRITLEPKKQYLFNLTVEEQDSVSMDMYLYSNETNKFGEPILFSCAYETNLLYFAPKMNETKCILVIKALEGNSNFTLNISEVENKYTPSLSDVFVESTNPDCNYTLNRYNFYVNYTDNDTSNFPAQFVYLEIKELNQNFTMNKDPFDFNFTNGVEYSITNFEFKEIKLYHYIFWASDGYNITRYPLVGNLTIEIKPYYAINIPYLENFSSVTHNWTVEGTGWERLGQENFDLLGHPFDDRSRIFPSNDFNPDWYCFYYGNISTSLTPYSYQPLEPNGEWINGSLISPIINLTDIDESYDLIAKFGIRASINALDFIYLQININCSTNWQTLRIYTNTEREWFMEDIGLSSYLGNYIRFRFYSGLNEQRDLQNYKGFMVDYAAIENYSNYYDPQIITQFAEIVTPNIDEVQYEYDIYTFSIDVYDIDNNYPTYVYVEINDNNYTMNNVYGDWDCSSNITFVDIGIRFEKGLYIEDFEDLTFRFHAYDGNNISSTEWYNEEENPLIKFSNPIPFNYSTEFGYEFNVQSLDEFYITGFPEPRESTIWLSADDTWHCINSSIYCGIGQLNVITSDNGYGANWNAKLITHPLNLGTESNNFIQFFQNITLENESATFYEGNDYDQCNISISTDYGATWYELIKYTYLNNREGHYYIDISSFNGETIMVKFELDSNDETNPSGLGWCVKDLFIGYSVLIDFINLAPKTVVNNVQIINVSISEKQGYELKQIELLINDTLVNATYENGMLTFVWDTLLYLDGEYVIEIVVYDNYDNKIDTSIIIIVDNIPIWIEWLPWLIFIGVLISLSIIIGLLTVKKGIVLIDKIKANRSIRKERTIVLDKEKEIIRKRIENLTKEELKERPYTYFCKNCKSWFVDNSGFKWNCPSCNTDQLYLAYQCPICKKWYFIDDPGDYDCKKCKIKMVKLSREEIKKELVWKSFDELGEKS